jgi:hypothetical protein
MADTGTGVPNAKPTKHWYSPRLWWIIPGVLVLGAAGAGAVVATRPKSHVAAPSTHSRSTNKTASNAVGTGYLASTNDGVIFIQWTQTGDMLSGTAEDDTLSGSPPNQTVATDTITVSGQVNKSQISLSFNGGASVFGTLSGGSFTVNFPQTDGSLAAITFRAASATQFNQALSNLQSNTGSANQSAAQAETITSEQQSINSEAQTVSSDISDADSFGGGGLVQLEASLKQVVAGVQQGLAGVEQGLTATQKAEQQVAAESGTSGSSICGDAGSVDGDAGSVQGDAGSVEGDAGSVESELQSVRSQIGTLQSDFQAFQQAESAQPSYQPNNPPTQSQINQAVSAANSEVSSALSATNGYINQANADVVTAYGYVATAYQDGDCGPAPTAPQGEPPIS